MSHARRSSPSLRFTLLILTMTCAPGAARASGSVAVTAVSQRHDLTLSQTFRRTLRPGTARRYLRSTRARFLQQLAPQTAAIDALLQRRAKRLALGRFELTLPVAWCKEQSCPALATTRFPALVALAAMQLGGNTRLAYTVKVVFSRRPRMEQLTALRRKIQRTLEAQAAKQPGSRSDKPARSVELTRLERRHGTYKLVLGPKGLWGSPSTIKRLRGQLGALAKKIDTPVSKRLGGAAPAVALIRHDDKLPFLGDGQRLPAQTSAQADSPYLQAQVFIAVKRYRDRAALETLIKGLGADLSRGLGRSPAR